MAPGISYDDSGSLASYFGVTFLAFVLVPTTYVVLKPKKKETAEPLIKGAKWDTTAHDNAKAKARKSSNRLWTRIIPLFIGWAIFGTLCYLIAVAPKVEGQSVYNPFEILGLSDSSTEKQIKKHYKKLAILLFSHPDKIQLAVNQTKEDADAKFVELTKAYKALTDETTRENLAKYGNPDGAQPREDKIAIPKWVVEGKSSIWVLALYGVVLGGLIPYIVGRWWFSQRKITRDGVLNNTAELFFSNLREDTDYISLVALLSSSFEYVPLLADKSSRSKKERKERQASIDALQKQLDEVREQRDVDADPNTRAESKINVNSAAAKRAQALIWAHLLRYDLDNAEWQDHQLSVLLLTPVLLNAMLNISLAHNWLKTTASIIKLQAALVQALPPQASPLEQFPGISHDQAIELEVVKGSEGKSWAEKAVRKDALSGPAKEIAEQWPRLDVTEASFTVDGEELITPGSIVTLTFNLRYRFPGSSIQASVSPANGANGSNGVKEEKPDVNGADDEEERAPIDLELIDPTTLEKEKTWARNGYAYAPLWPQLRRPHFQILLGDSKLDKVIIQPTRVTDIPLPSIDGRLPEPREFTLQFQAPPQANLYSFVLYALSDTFLGSDVSLPIMLNVQEPPPEVVESEEEDADDDISDPEEDTLAGQMAMMRGGKVKPSAVHGSADDDDSESEYEYEYESSSDEDGPAVKKSTTPTGSKDKGRKGKAINEDTSSDEE